MTMLRGEPMPWQSNSSESYVPILHEGAIVGFCKPDYAQRIVTMLNEDEVLHKAMRSACTDLLRHAGGDPSQLNGLIKSYIDQAKRPKSGSAAIAVLLRDRQDELGVKDAEFVQFCNINRLSPEWLKDIYAGEAVSDRILGPLAKILGITVERLVEIRDGKSAS